MRAELEDDYHCMRVTLHHDGESVTSIEPEMIRAPWTTCPGAVEKLKSAFAGTPLADFAKCEEKTQNCTHLFDLALLGAAHAQDVTPTSYEVMVTDPIDGVRRAELHCDGEVVVGWTEENFKIVEPQNLQGLRLTELRSWMESLTPRQQEAARILRWANMMANGRIIPIEQQSDASKMPPGCYTFQPHRAVQATRIGMIYDFSSGNSRQPLEGLNEAL